MAALYSAITQFKCSAFDRKDTVHLAYEVSARTMPETSHLEMIVEHEFICHILKGYRSHRSYQVTDNLFFCYLFNYTMKTHQRFLHFSHHTSALYLGSKKNI